MSQRRGPQEATSQTPHKATGHREASTFAHPIEGGVTVRELLVAGGLRGFTAKEALA